MVSYLILRDVQKKYYLGSKQSGMLTRIVEEKQYCSHIQSEKDFDLTGIFCV